MLNGKVLLTGSQDNTIAGSSSAAEEYNPTTNTVAVKTPMAHERHSHTATTMKNGKVLIAGSEYTNAGQSVTEIYDPSTGTFATGPTMNYPRYKHNAVLLPNGKILLVGNTLNNSGRSIAEVFDPQTNTLSTTANAHTPVLNPSSVMLQNGKVLTVGGTTTADLYDPSTNTWTRTGATVNDTSYSNLKLLPNGKVISISSQGTGAGLTLSQLYDPSTNTWTAGPSTSQSRVYTQMQYLPISNKYLITNGDSTGSGSTAEMYIPASDMPVSESNYENEHILNGVSQITDSTIFFKKPKVSVNSSGDAVVVWQENKFEANKFRGLSHNYDANAYLKFGKQASLNTNSSSEGGNTLQTIMSPVTSIAGQKICNQSSCDAGTTSGERQWGNDQNIYNKNNPENLILSSVLNSRNPSIISEGTNTIISYDSDVGVWTDLATNPLQSSKNSKVFVEKINSSGVKQWTGNGWTNSSNSLTIDRVAPSSVVLNDGRVLVYSGFDQFLAGIDSANLINPLTGLISTTTNTPPYPQRK